MERNIVNKIKISLDQYSSMKSMEDFYKMTGVLDLKYATFIDVQKIHMNNDECEYLKELMFKNNYRKGKFKYYKKKYLDKCVGMEWLYYSPNNIVLDVPEGELWLEEGWCNNGKKATQ